MTCIIPPALPKNRPISIRVVAPSGTLMGHEQRLENGIQILKEAGFRVKVRGDLMSRSSRGYLGGTDDQRQQELVEAILDPTTDLVWWARGGSGGGRIVESVLEDLKHASPKWLLGFSDATSLLNAISLKLGWVTLHGPTVTFLESQKHCISELMEVTEDLQGQRRPWQGQDYPVYGGNITVLASLMGTQDLSTIHQHVLLFEDVNESPYRLDRSITQIRMQWPLDKIEYLWLGDLGLPKEDAANVINGLKEDFPCPVKLGAPAGHSGKISIIPIGYKRIHHG